MAWRGCTILEALTGGPKLTRELTACAGVPDLKGCLRSLRARGFVSSAEGVHTITEQGRQALASGQKLTSGPCPRKAQARQRRSLRDKAWSAMRGRDFFSVEDLLFLLLSDGDSTTAQRNLQGYVTALEGAGYLVRKNSKGPRRYRLRLDMNTGVLAPAWNKSTRTVTDPNTGKRVHVPANNTGATNELA